MTEENTRKDWKLRETLAELQKELSPSNVMVAMVYEYPETQEYEIIDIGADCSIATVTFSPRKLTVIDDIKRTAHTFIIGHDLKTLISQTAYDPLYWSFQMARHSNNGAVDECHYWDWEEYQSAVYAQLQHWEKNLGEDSDEFLTLKASCDEIMHAAPSLPDVRALERKWNHIDHDLVELVPVDDYLIWDRGYLKALLVIKQVVERNQATSKQINHM